MDGQCFNKDFFASDSMFSVLQKLGKDAFDTWKLQVLIKHVLQFFVAISLEVWAI